MVYTLVDIGNIAGETHQLSSSFRGHLETLSKGLDQLKKSKGLAGPVGRVGTTDPNCDLKCFIGWDPGKLESGCLTWSYSLPDMEI